MSILSVAQDVADAIGLTRPTAIITDTTQVPRQILAMAKKTLDDLAKLEWPVLQKDYSFQTVVGQSVYPLPNDWLREIGDTAYLASQYYKLRGSLTPGDWARQQNALPAQIGRYKIRFYGDPVAINITPTPQTVETVVLEYYTVNRVIQSDGTRVPDYTSDTDTSIFPEELMRKGIEWRLKRAKGLDYSEEFNDYEDSKKTRLAQALALGSSPIAYRHLIEDPEIPAGYVPEFGFGQ